MEPETQYTHPNNAIEESGHKRCLMARQILPSGYMG